MRNRLEKCPAYTNDRRGIGDAERALPNARRKVSRRSEGNKNAFKHGRYSADAIALRKLVRQLVSEAKETVESI